MGFKWDRFVLRFVKLKVIYKNSKDIKSQKAINSEIKCLSPFKLLNQLAELKKQCHTNSMFVLHAFYKF